jgi:hypothetical protein
MNIVDNKDNNASTSVNYNSDACITYVFYDTKYNTTLRDKLNIVISQDAISEFKDDYDVIQVLYMREIRHIFNIDDSEIDNEITKRCMQLFDIVDNSSLSKCIDVLVEKPSILQSPLNNSNTLTTQNDIRHNIFPILFSYDLLFFTHLCLRDLFVDGVIKPIHIETLYEAIHRYI